MSDRFPNLGPMPTNQGHAPSLSTGAASAQAGMVRIHRGSEVRYVWPVHVPGWLSSGWQLGDDRQSSEVEALVSSPAHAPEPAPAPSSQPEAAPERQVEPIEAHLPTNLLGLDAEPAEAQGSTAENDAVFASIGVTELIAAPAPIDVAAAVAERAEPDHTITQVVEPTGDGSEAPAADPIADRLAESSPEPTAPTAPARRGRPRKVRTEPEQQPAAEVTADDQPPAAQESEDQQAHGAVITT